MTDQYYRPVAQRLEHRSPKPGVGGSNPFWPATYFASLGLGSLGLGEFLKMTAMEKVTAFVQDTIQFFREVKVELQKVTFPTRQETVGSTIVVLILTVIIGIYLGFSDWALARIVQMLLQG